MFLRLLSAEAIKLREPMTLLAFFGAPALIGALTLLGAATRNVDYPWALLLMNLTMVWVSFLFPLSVVALTAFAAQIEHRTRAWDHLLTLPAPKWLVFATKSLVVALAALASYPLFVACALAGGALGGLLSPHGQFTGAIELGPYVRPLALSAGAGLLLIALQHWVALRFSHFVVPVFVGVGAYLVTMLSNVFNRGDQTRLFPWSLPFRTYAAAQGLGDADALGLLVGVGLVGGLAAFVALSVHLSRREFR